MEIGRIRARKGQKCGKMGCFRPKTTPFLISEIFAILRQQQGRFSCCRLSDTKQEGTMSLITDGLRSAVSLKLTSIFLFVCLLSGCAGSPAWYAMSSKEEIHQHFLEICQSYGLKPNTRDMTQCLMDERRSNAATRESRLKMSSDNLQRQLDRESRQIESFNEGNRPNQPTNTTCRELGDTIQCTTY